MCPPGGPESMRRTGTPSGERPEAVRIWLLGGFRVTVGSRTIDDSAWRLRKAASLRKVLALAPSHRLHREQVMELLWPDSGRRAASNNLRQVLYAARRILDPALAKACDIGAGHHAACGIVEVLPAPLATVRAAIDLQEILEFVCDLNHGSHLLSLSAAVRFTIPRIV
jgi:DNA-binding SARP family transcriptional activator